MRPTLETLETRATPTDMTGINPFYVPPVVVPLVPPADILPPEPPPPLVIVLPGVPDPITYAWPTTTLPGAVVPNPLP